MDQRALILASIDRLKGVDFPPFRLSADGHWWTPEGDHGSPGWIEDQWMRGNLRLAKDHSPETESV